MTAREFMQKVTRGGFDVLDLVVEAMESLGIGYCVVGGLAVNAYSEPVVSLDCDLAVVSCDMDRLVDALSERFSVRRFPNSVNLSHPSSDLRVQLQTDQRYETFPVRAERRLVLGREMPVACIEDVLQGKVWAALDDRRRPSKRAKDLADILRLLDVAPELAGRIPVELRDRLLV